MIKNKIILFMLVMILVIPFGMCFEFDNIKKYNKDTKTITIINAFGLGGDLAFITLEENTYYCIFNCHAIIKLDLRKDYNNPFSDLKFYTERLFPTSIESYDISLRDGSYQVDVGEWTKECHEEINGTVCEYVRSPKYETRYTYNKKYNGEELKSGIHYFKISGKKKRWQTIEWIPDFLGIEISEWATWTDSFNVNLTAYYDFETGSGVHVVERVNGNAGGTLTDLDEISSWVDGKVGDYGIYFNGTGGTYINISSDELDAAFGGKTDKSYTYNFWIRLNSTVTGNAELFSKPISTTTPTFYISFYRETGGNVSAGIVMKQVGTSNHLDVKCLTDVSLVLDTWYMATWVSTGRTGAAQTFYLNGVENCGKTINKDTLSSDLTNTAGELWIGNARTVLSIITNGTIDEFGVWNRSLSASEILDLWNGGSGLIYAPIPFNISVDLISPENNIEINVTSGYSINFVGDFNSSFGYTFSNTTLYIWNETNNIISKNFLEIDGGTTNRTNLTVSNLDFGNYEWNYEACGNDSSLADCKQASANRTFDITLWYETTYNSTAYETTSEGFGVNISYNSEVYTGITASLFYDGNGYASTEIADSGGYAYFDNSIDISGIGAKNLYWNFTMANSTDTIYKTTDTFSQTILGAFFILCNATYDVSYLNFTFQNEADTSQENATIDASTWTYWISTQSINKTYTFSSTSELANYTFCFTPPDRTINLDYSLQYSSDGYPQRRYTKAEALTNTTTHRTLYILATTDGSYSIYSVQTAAGNPIQKVKTEAERLIGGVYKLVESGETDSAGSVTLWLNPDYDHRLTFTKTGYTSVQIILRPSSSIYTVTMTTTDVEAVYNSSLEGIKWIFSPPSGRLDKDENYLFEFNITASLNNLVGCKIELLNVNDTILNSTTGCNSAGGNISVSLNTTINKLWGRYSLDFGEGYVIIDQDAYWILIDYVSRTSLWHFFKDIKNIKEFGDDEGRQEYSRIVLFFAVLIIGFAAVSKVTGWDASNPGGMLLLLCGVIWIASFPGFLTLTNVTPWDKLDRYIVAFIVSLITVGYSTNAVRRIS